MKDIKEQTVQRQSDRKEIVLININSGRKKYKEITLMFIKFNIKKLNHKKNIFHSFSHKKTGKRKRKEQQQHNKNAK